MRGMPTYRQIECFLAAAETASFRAAAERLNMTQPPLSRQIQGLETLVGGKLFTRSTSGVALTERGRLFTKEAKLLIAHFHKISNRLQRIGPDSEKKWNIGFTSVHAPDLFGLIRQELSFRLGESNVRYVYNISRRLIEMMSRKKLDLVFIGCPVPIPKSGYKVFPLKEEDMCIALSSKHIHASKEFISLKDLSYENIFFFQRNRNKDYYDKCEKLFNDIGCEFRKIPEPQDHYILLSLIASGEGFAIMPRSLTAIERDGVVYLRLIEPEAKVLRITLCIAYMDDIKTELVPLVNEIVKSYRAV